MRRLSGMVAADRVQPSVRRPADPPSGWLPRPAARHVVVLAGDPVRERWTIQATEVIEQHLGRPWQRWSRHLQPMQWQSGWTDSKLSRARGIELKRCVLEPVR